jgi:hypothetical protein
MLGPLWDEQGLLVRKEGRAYAGIGAREGECALGSG